ncbi:MAG: hypothetical protein IPG89_15955 [Bacteroidetes bacterium]|nr:hypothetical protein [Bacteroidota bacterium]
MFISICICTSTTKICIPRCSNASGNPIVSQTVSIRASVLDASPSGTVQYSETHSVVTNAMGLFYIEIGAGVLVSGSFTAITWEAGAKFMKVEFDPTGGSTYTLVGTTQILSVPYALHAANAKTYKAGTGIAITANDTIKNTAPDQTVSLSATGSTTITGTYPNFTMSSPRMVAGSVQGGFSPSIFNGGGFSIVRNSTGFYTVTFIHLFNYFPTVVSSICDPTFLSGPTYGFIRITDVTTTGFYLYTYGNPGVASNNLAFSIIAVGN